MRGSRLAALALALGSCALTQPFCFSQKSDEKKGQSLPIESLPAAPRPTSPLPRVFPSATR
jgi:hypothetical protein